MVARCSNCGGALYRRQAWLHGNTDESGCYDEGDPLHRVAQPEAVFDAAES